MKKAELKALMDEAVDTYNRPHFIEHDPVGVPHWFNKKQDQEIAGLFAATLAWGQRKTIIESCKKLMTGMDYAPHQFVCAYQPKDLKVLKGFVHRTFQFEDLQYFLRFLQYWYQNNESLQSLFMSEGSEDIGPGLIRFQRTFFSLADAPERTRKHVASPERKSACKRLNMFLRWMVRKDECGVDLGLWNNISASQLICPLDVHSGRVARSLGLLKRKQNDWQAAIELTEALRKFDTADPVKYDFALFGFGVEGIL